MGNEWKATHLGYKAADEGGLPDASKPPVSQRSSFWVRTFEFARQRGDWVRVPRFYTMTTASQLASDIINANRRDQATVRMRGILPGETWEARWGHAPDGPNGDYVVWIRLAQTNG